MKQAQCVRKDIMKTLGRKMSVPDIHCVFGPAGAKILLCIFLLMTVSGMSRAETAEVSLLSTASGDRTGDTWRVFVVCGSDLVRLKSGERAHLYEFSPCGTKKVKGKRKKKLNVIDRPTHTELPAKGWREPDFNDSSWAEGRGPFYLSPDGVHGSYRSMHMICLRGRFSINDPSKIDGLKLYMDFQGGAAVYINGKQLTRVHIPDEDVPYITPAEDYPSEVYLTPDGQYLLRKKRDYKKFKSLIDKRARHISGFAIPSSVLRKGENIIAVEVHRAPAPEIMFMGRTKKLHSVSHVKGRCWWSRIGVGSIRLTASADTAAANSASPEKEKIRIHNLSIVKRLYKNETSGFNGLLRPVQLCGVRNGTFSGSVMISAACPVTGLECTVNGLKGPGTIPASAVQVRYGMPDGKRRKQIWFDGLEEIPPGTVEPDPKTGYAVQPVWITVNVPADAKPGKYTGELTVKAAGESHAVPVKLTVKDWTLPDPDEFLTHIGLVQSPETLAVKYNVPMWSDRHWELIERSMKLLGRVGNKSLYITLIRRSHFGNEHAMVRWIRKNGRLEPDLSIAEKYIDIGVKHLGKIPMVGLYCWEPEKIPAHYPHPEGGNYAQGDREILITICNPDTGSLEKAKGPAWETPECAEFWKPAFSGLIEILQKHGIERSAMLGIACDYIPSSVCIRTLSSAAPGIRWINHCHVYRSEFAKQPVGYLSSVWGLQGTRDPALPPDYYGNTRFYGWRNPFRVVAFPRAGNPVYYISLGGKPGLFRLAPEGAIVSASRVHVKPVEKRGVKGFGRLGADFWPVIKANISGRGIGRGHDAPLCGRYPDSHAGGMALTYVSYYVLSPGKEGPVSSQRFEMICEGVQEAEARVFIEKALLDPAQKEKLGSELAERCQALLDERVRTFIRGAGKRNYYCSNWLWYEGPIWAQQSEALYTAAAEAAAVLKDR